MKPRISVITLGVDDLSRALKFYRDGLGLATEGIIGEQYDHGAVVFIDLQPTLKLALWPRASIIRELGIEADSPSPSHAMISHNVSNRDEVDSVMDEAAAAGAQLLKPAHETFWGGYAGYFCDPDQHVWEVVWNPDWVISD
ncbi:MAG: VOC family protein [Methylophaga sp.]|nr:VOC family protein [Methylophaga sp.]